MMIRSYSFCEPSWAGSRARWCIRPLTENGLKLSGGVDTPSLCGRVDLKWGGWDVAYPIPTDKPDFCCPKCWEAYTSAK